jgi:hypothetical protein
MMILAGLKKYLKCHKFYFVPLGILSIFVVIGLTMSISGITGELKNFFTQVGEMAKSTKLDWNLVWQTLISETSKIDYSQPFNQIVQTVTSSTWLNGLLNAVVQALFGGEIAEQAASLIGTTIQNLINWVVAFFFITIIGLVIGFFVVKILVRKELTEVKTGKLILYALLDSLFWGVFLTLITFINPLSKVVSIILMIIYVISLMFICLLEGYLFYGIKKVKFKEVMKIKNVLKLYLIALIIIAICASIVAILFLIFHPVIALYVSFPFVEIAIAAISLNAESYVVEFVNQNKEKPIKELKAKK